MADKEATTNPDGTSAAPAPVEAATDAATVESEPVRPEAAADAYVVFQSEVNQQTAEVLCAEMGKLAAEGAQRVTLVLSTPGGNVFAGLNTYQILRALPFELTVFNAGSVNSIGIAVFLAGEHRFSVPHGTFLFHGVGFNVKANDRFEEKTLLERLQSIRADQQKIAAVIADRTLLDEKEIALLFLEQSTKDLDYARTVRIIHDVRELQLTKGVPVSQFVFQR